MDKWLRRALYYTVVVVAVMVGFAVLYHHGMRIFEGESHTFLHSLQVVVETFTTTGFGSDAPWDSAEMNTLVIIMDLTGVILLFTALPVLAFPLLQDALSTSVPTTLDDGVTDHVVVCSDTSRAEALIAELESWDVPYVILEPDRERATTLSEDGYRVVHGDPETVAGLGNAGLRSARALVADRADRVDASIVLTARELSEDVPILSVVEEPDRAAYHRLAGADEVLSPRVVLGESLAAKITTAVTTDLGDAVEIGTDFEMAELPIHRGSRLVGRTLADSEIRERTGVNVIGAWFRGEFVASPTPDERLASGTVLLVTGHEDQLEALKELTLSPVRRYESGEALVLGYGQVGRTVAAALGEADVPYTVVDTQDMDGVDVVGDAVDRETLDAAGIDRARSVILALPDDATTEFATLAVRDRRPEIEAVARVEEAASVRKLYRAGADYVLSLATVNGRMIASKILEDEAVLSLDKQVDVVRTAAPGLVGRTIEEAAIPDTTGCTVVAIERDGEVIADVGPDRRIETGDDLVIAGTDEGIRRFNERFG